MTVPVLASVSGRILSLHGWVALLVVFVVPFLEASAFVGFVFPGEIAVLLGGVLAYEGRISLPAAIVAAVLGAILGDNLGYEIGKRWGRTLLDHTVGRVVKSEHIDRAEAYLRRRGGSAVFFGRFTAALRVLVPGLAGMSRIPYPEFFAWNAAGGALWGTGFVLLGYAGGASWRHVEHVASRAGLVLLALILIALGLSHAVRSREARSRTARAFARLGHAPPVAWFRRRFPRAAGWLAARFDLRSAAGLPLTAAVTATALCAWAFGALSQDVLTRTEWERFDPTVLRFFVGHRSGAATGAMRAVSELGSVPVLIAVAAAIGLLIALRRRRWGPLVRLGLALGGAQGLAAAFKAVVDRARPPLAERIGHFTGGSFPSGHATDSVAVYGMAAVLAWTLWSNPKVRSAVWGFAILLAAGIGASRLYLAAHWLTDVLAGYALGGIWLFLLVAWALATGGRRGASPGQPASGHPAPSP